MAKKKKAATKKKSATKKKKSEKKTAKPKEEADDLVAPKKRNSKGKIAIIRRAYKEGAEKGIGFARTVWSDIWEKRILRDFMLKNNMKTSAVILTDLIPVPLHRFVYGWKSGERSFAKRDYSRCRHVEFDAEGHLVETGKSCAACTFFGTPPGIALLFAIGDIRRQYDKDGNEMPWAVKRILLNNYTVRDAIIQAVELAAAREKREEEIAGNVFQVSRGPGRQTVRIGDVWVYEKFANTTGKTFTKMLSLVPDWNEEYPPLDEKTIKSMCQIHMQVGAKHSLDQNDMWDSDGAQELFGTGGVATPKGGSPSASKTETSNTVEEDDLMGPSAGSSKGPELSEMDDIDEEETEGEEKEEEEAEATIEVGSTVTCEVEGEEVTGKVTKIKGKKAVVDDEEYEYTVELENLTLVKSEEEEEEEDEDLPFAEEDL